MSDLTLRTLARRAAQGDPRATVRLLLARVRAGAISPVRLRLAAALGHEPARDALAELGRTDPDFEERRALGSALVTALHQLAVTSSSEVHALQELLAWEEPLTDRVQADSGRLRFGLFLDAFFADWDDDDPDARRALQQKIELAHRILDAALFLLEADSGHQTDDTPLRNLRRAGGSAARGPLIGWALGEAA